MLDNFICYNQIFKRISDWKVKKIGVRSDHTAIVTKIRLTSIKFNNEQQKYTIIDWEKIRTDEETIFLNDKLYELIKNNKSLSNDYTTFNSAILLVSQVTETKERTKNQGWFHHSELNLFPVIQHRDQLLHHIRLKDPSEDTTTIKVELRAAQNVVSDHVSLSKVAWFTHQAKIIHNMQFTPKDAW